MTVVGVDMRSWQAPEQADILVSELLGSFGDNELSPECLDGAQRFLKSDGDLHPLRLHLPPPAHHLRQAVGRGSGAFPHLPCSPPIFQSQSLMTCVPQSARV